ncbi:hypothetical protein CCUG62472_03783 [Mycobacteroides salmoniphilum]|nr:hypothetical protein CCUG62472_03783 [Mycobacteroides salmoniphilum]
MLARLHEDLAEYWALAGPLYSADPVLHTVELHVGARLRRTASDPAVALITLTDLGHLEGAAMVTGQGLLCNAIPMAGVTATVSLLAKAAIRLPAVRGAPAVTLAVADTWVSMTGAAISDTTDERLYRLDHFQPPRVSGRPQPVAADAIEVMVPWSIEYSLETFGVATSAAEARRWLAGSYQLGDVYLQWEHGGVPVAMAACGRRSKGYRGSVRCTPRPRIGAAATAAPSRRRPASGRDKREPRRSSSPPIWPTRPPTRSTASSDFGR